MELEILVYISCAYAHDYLISQNCCNVPSTLEQIKFDPQIALSLDKGLIWSETFWIKMLKIFLNILYYFVSVLVCDLGFFNLVSQYYANVPEP